ncbi:MAG: Hpt domain-containing protein [Frankiaceae bacterium]|nr:Hpt domain-containing protein [Frankiaceae bacterium]
MATSEEGAVRAAVARLPESALASLREAFAEEVSERLPRLREAARTLSPALLAEALRDVHTLGSSAYVVGENDAARTARAAEALLIDDGPLEAFAALVVELDKRLSGWVR